MQENFGPSKTFAPDDCGQGTTLTYISKVVALSREADRNRTLRHRSPLTAKSIQSGLTLCDPWTVARQDPLCPWDSPGKNAGLGCRFLLQGIFPTQGSNPCLLYLVYWQVGSLPLVPHRKSASTGETISYRFSIVV